MGRAYNLRENNAIINEFTSGAPREWDIYSISTKIGYSKLGRELITQ